MKKELRPKPRPKFVLRKVRNGRVKILGNWYSPVVSHPNSPYPRKEYNGELDGMWFAFGLYWTPTTGFENVKWYCEDFVGLWGTKEMYEAETEEEYLEACKNQLNVIDGTYHWDTWVTEDYYNSNLKHNQYNTKES